MTARFMLHIHFFLLDRIARTWSQKQKSPAANCEAFLYGAPGRSRTSDLLVRSQTLYPAELRAHVSASFAHRRRGIITALFRWVEAGFRGFRRIEGNSVTDLIPPAASLSCAALQHRVESSHPFRVRSPRSVKVSAPDVTPALTTPITLAEREGFEPSKRL